MKVSAVLCLGCLTFSEGATPSNTCAADDVSCKESDFGYASSKRSGGGGTALLGKLAKIGGGIIEPPQHEDGSVKYLWTHAEGHMGFGDKVRMHYSQRNLAAVLGRTWIAPPFHFTQAVPKKVKNKQTSDMSKSALSRVYKPGYTPDRFYEVSEWFDKEKLDFLGPVIGHDEWYNGSGPGAGGHVDVVVVPGQKWHSDVGGYKKDWYRICRKDGAKKGSSRVVHRFDKETVFHRVHCLDTKGVIKRPKSDDDIYHMKVGGIPKDQAVELLTRGGLSDVVVLGLDSFMNSASIMAVDDGLYGQSFYSMAKVEDSDNPKIRRFWDIRRCFRWNDNMLSEAAQFMKDQNEGKVAPYLALHWRHGDKLQFNINTEEQRKNQTPEGMAARVKNALQKYPKKDVAALETLFLATANFIEDDLQKFADLIKAQLGLKVVRYPGELPLKAVGMDMALASGASIFFGDDRTSMFTTFIRDERRLQGMERDDGEYLLQWI